MTTPTVTIEEVEANFKLEEQALAMWENTQLVQRGGGTFAAVSAPVGHDMPLALKGLVVKIFHPDGSGSNTTQRRAAVEEVASLKMMEHAGVKNVPKVIGWTDLWPMRYGSKRCAIVMEDGGRSAQDQWGEMEEHQKLDLLCQVLVILMEIHEAGFAHNDVKLANITINCEGRATLIDVGSVTRVKDGRSEFATAMTERNFCQLERTRKWQGVSGLGESVNTLDVFANDAYALARECSGWPYNFVVGLRGLDFNRDAYTDRLKLCYYLTTNTWYERMGRDDILETTWFKAWQATKPPGTLWPAVKKTDRPDKLSLRMAFVQDTRRWLDGVEAEIRDERKALCRKKGLNDRREASSSGTRGKKIGSVTRKQGYTVSSPPTSNSSEPRTAPDVAAEKQAGPAVPGAEAAVSGVSPEECAERVTIKGKGKGKKRERDEECHPRASKRSKPVNHEVHNGMGNEKEKEKVGVGRAKSADGGGSVSDVVNGNLDEGYKKTDAMDMQEEADERSDVVSDEIENVSANVFCEVDGENAGGIEGITDEGQGENAESSITASEGQVHDVPAPLQAGQGLRRSSRLRTRPRRYGW